MKALSAASYAKCTEIMQNNMKEQFLVILQQKTGSWGKNAMALLKEEAFMRASSFKFEASVGLNEV